MKIFSAIQTQWSEFYNAVSSYLSKVLGKDGNYGPSNIFGQIFTVINGMMQNLMLYIEDALSEQNIDTAQRKKSIYSLARLSGYEPSLGTASRCNIKMIYKPESSHIMSLLVIPNHTTLQSKQNGLTYNMILPQESIVYDLQKDNSIKHMTLVEGTFNEQDYVSDGGELYTINIPFTGDMDMNFFTVNVNGEVWNKVDGLYDMQPDGKEYYVECSLSKGVDVIFGNGQFGRVLKDGDQIKITFLSHNGEDGNIKPDGDTSFVFTSSLHTVTGDDVDGNTIFNVTLEDRGGVTSGTYSEDAENVRSMIGYNSRSLVLADAKNYKIFLNRFSFVGYSRCWSEPGSLVVNAMVMKNYKRMCESGLDYFSLTDDDFTLSPEQQESIRGAIVQSGQQIGGTVLNFITPELKKYAVFIYMKMKTDATYDQDIISNQVRALLGDFFGNIKSDIYIPKSDIIHIIKSNIPAVDGVNIYIIGKENEEAKTNGRYTEKKYTYNPATMTYKITETIIPVKPGIDPQVGFDSHGNILLDSDMDFPVLMGGWRYGSGNNTVMVNDPVQIIYQS